ncbi:MAG: hypothetical protein AB1560_12475 [Pseudomonadota bacterium]
MSPTSAVRILVLTGTIFLVVLLLAACNGDGGDGGTVVPPVSGTGSQLYVGGNTSPRLLIYNDANTASGSTLPNRVVSGGLTTLNGPRGIAVDMAHDQIYVANFLGDSVLVFHNARTVTGGEAPARTIIGGPLNKPSALFMDAVNDRLYVANTGGNSVLVYDNASSLNGAAVPDRILTGNATSLIAPTGIYSDITRNLLYVTNGDNRMLVFSDAATTTGNVPPARTVSGLSSPTGIYVDVMMDRLYVANTGTNSIAVFDGVSTADGSPAPDRVLFGGVTGLVGPRDVFVDTGTDRLYVANFGNDSVLVFDGAGSVNGNVAPTRSLGLMAATGPWGLYVDVSPIVVGSTANLDGYARSDSTASATSSPATGDREAGFFGVGWRQLYSFGIASIPASATITSATLRLHQCDVSGSPYALLGNVVVDHVSYGDTFDPFGGAYDGATVAFNIGTLSTSASLGNRTLNVTTRVQNDLAASRLHSQYRLRFSPFDVNFDFADDFAQFTDAEDSPCAGTTTNQPPQLAITLKR